MGGKHRLCHRKGQWPCPLGGACDDEDGCGGIPCSEVQGKVKFRLVKCMTRPVAGAEGRDPRLSKEKVFWSVG